jgi:hypothetical protein
MRSIQAIIGEHEWLALVPIPDLAIRRHRPRILIKSVNVGRARLFAEAWPESRIILILRHPCGQIASFIRGIGLGKFPPLTPLDDMLCSPEAERLGLKLDPPTVLSVAEQLAWEWAFLNQRMLDDLAGMTRVKIIQYEQLAAEPVEVARDLFGFTDLSWNAETERFIAKSTISDGSDSYYGLARDPLQAANRWRETLPSGDQQRIMAMACRVAVGRFFAQRTPVAVDPGEAAALMRHP